MEIISNINRRSNREGVIFNGVRDTRGNTKTSLEHGILIFSDTDMYYMFLTKDFINKIRNKIRGYRFDLILVPKAYLHRFSRKSELFAIFSPSVNNEIERIIGYE